MENNDEYLQHLVSATNLLNKILLSYKINPDPLFKKAGIDPNLLNDPLARIECQKVDRVWELASQKIDDPCFAINAGHHWHPSFMNALGYSWLVSSTLKEALETLVRYFCLISNTIKVSIQPVNKGLTIVLDYDQQVPPDPNRCIAFFSVLLKMCRINFGEELCPVQVQFIQTKPECQDVFFNYFKSKILFSSGRDSIIFSENDMHHQLPGGNPHLEKIHDQIIQEYLHKRTNQSIIQKVSSEIANRLASGKVTDDYIAQRLYMSVRTLQRKLQKQGTRFQTIFDSTRKKIALQYFKDPRLGLQEIAFLTGFSEYSSFSRAFKRWTGDTPSEMRLKLLS